MKKIVSVVLLVFGVLCLIFSAFGVYAFVLMDQVEYIIIVVIFALLGVFLVRKGRPPSARMQEKQRRREEKRRLLEEKKQLEFKTLACKHFVGLPLSEKSAATLFFGDTDLQISGGGNHFSLAYAKIYSMEIRTDVELHQAYVSSAGGAIAGEALFGPIGGMIGGRVQEKRTSKIEDYLIISYDKDGETQYMSFLVTFKEKAMRNIDQINSQFAAPRHTVL